MSRKDKRPVILGPDGKPYVAPPKPAEPIDITASIVPGSFRMWLTTSGIMNSPGTNTPDDLGRDIPRAVIRKPDLRSTVTDQICQLVEAFDGHGGAELPTPPRDLTTYRDAFASAARKCLHEDAVEILYGREWTCDACGRSLNRDDMRRARASSNPFRWFGL